MKFLHTSDWHVGRTLRGRNRHDEHAAVLDQLVGIAAESSVDLVVIAGDLFDTTTPSAMSEQLVYGTLRRFVETGARVVVVAGNHDSSRRLAAVEPLAGSAGIDIAASVRRPADGGVLRLDAGGAPVAIALVPFVSQRALLGIRDLLDIAPDQRNQRYADSLARIVAALATAFDTNTVNIVAAHLMVDGATLGGGERTAHTIFEYSVPAASFPANAHYVALGHLHRPQELPAPMPVRYCGAPLHLDFGEEAHRRTATVVDAEPGRPASVRTVPLTAGRDLATVRGTLDELEVLAEAHPAEREEWLRIVVAPPVAANSGRVVRDWFPNAVDVVLPRRQSSDTRERVDMAAPPEELFAAYLVDNQIDDARLVDLFRRLRHDESVEGDR